jgi:hypothetical protein
MMRRLACDLPVERRGTSRSTTQLLHWSRALRYTYLKRQRTNNINLPRGTMCPYPVHVNS